MTRKNGWRPYLAPLILALAVWVYGPAAFTAVLSLEKWNLTTPPSGFVGLDNYVGLFRHPEFARAVGQTLVSALALLPFATAVPLVLAVMLWQRPGRASAAYRAALFLPVVVAPVAVATAWRFLLNPLQGLMNRILEMFGASPMNWLGDPATALPVLVGIAAAKVVAFNLVLYAASLSGIDPGLVAAAQLEGATRWDIARFIVSPHVARPTAVLALLSMVLAGQWTFTFVSVLTQGGPDGVTDSVYYRIYALGFQFFDIGSASAAGILVLVAFGVLAAAWTAMRRSRRASS